KLIEGELRKGKKKNLKKSAYVECGTIYPPDVKKEGRIVHEWMPAISAGEEGELFLAYVSDDEGSNDVLLKWNEDGKRWGKPITIADSDADEYAPSVVAMDKGEALVAYVSNEKGGRYDIYSVKVKDGKPGKPRRVTRAEDDATAPDLAWDGKSAWLTWYEWRKMGVLSRDREVFVARGSGEKWSKAAQVSPKSVSAYEDHADPVVVPDGKGGAWVAWAWDYHPHTLKSKPPVDENSIFISHVSRQMKVGDPLAAGFRFTPEEIANKCRGRDYAPTLAIAPDGVPWVAWDNTHMSSAGYGAKALFVNRLTEEDFGRQFESAASTGPVCSPRLTVDPEGGVHLVWGQWKGRWELRARKVGPELGKKDRRLAVKGKVPRYPAATFDKKGQLWVAYTDTGSKKWKVQVEKLK
ncbi:MAG: TolB-like translocation protein, partial [Planctomycetota bacterium]